MKKLSSIALLFLCWSASSVADVFVDIEGPCEELDSYSTISELQGAVIEDGKGPRPQTLEIDKRDLQKLCEEFKKNRNEAAELKAIEISHDKDKWKLIFTYGPFLAYYPKTDMRLTNEDTDLTITGLQPIQRSGLHHYKFWSGDTRPFQFIDEPQNKIGLELANDNYFVGLEYSHPKILFQDNYATPENNHHVAMNGTIGNLPVSESDARLGAYIYQIQASHGNTNISAYAGKIFNLLNKKSKHDLELRLGAGAGIAFANGVTKYWVDGQQGLKINENQGMKVYGWNAMGRGGVRYTFPRDRVSLGVNYDLNYTRIDGPIGDFHVESNVIGHHIGLSLGVRLDDLFKKKKGKR